MCLSNFVEFKKIKKSEALIGYRNFRINIKEPTELISLYQDHKWKKVEGPHQVKDKDSGIYSYNNYYNYYYNYNNYNYYNNYNCYYNNNYNYYNYYYNYNYYDNNYYNSLGIIKQYGKVAIHKTGYRSQYAIVDALFTIRESDAQGPQKFLDWIKKLNEIITNLSKKYNCKTIHWQDFKNEAETHNSSSEKA